MNPKLEPALKLYDTDFALWIEQTAQLMRDHAFDQVDWENVIEEIESLGRSDKRALRSQVTRVIMHLLKWDYQPECRSNSWRGSIVEGHTQIEELLQDSPSLKPYLAQVLAKCYGNAVEQAGAETGLPINTFPVECPYTIDEVLRINDALRNFE